MDKIEECSNVGENLDEGETTFRTQFYLNSIQFLVKILGISFYSGAFVNKTYRGGDVHFVVFILGGVSGNEVSHVNGHFSQRDRGTKVEDGRQEVVEHILHPEDDKAKILLL